MTTASCRTPEHIPTITTGVGLRGTGQLQPAKAREARKETFVSCHRQSSSCAVVEEGNAVRSIFKFLFITFIMNSILKVTIEQHGLSLGLHSSGGIRSCRGLRGNHCRPVAAKPLVPAL